jgi:uncharacterized protein (DUF1778 family)
MPDDEDDATANTILAARIPEALRARIREAAKREERSESGFVRFHLARIAEAILAEAPTSEDAAHP